MSGYAAGVAPLVALALVAGCTLGPDYRRPQYPIPRAYRATPDAPPPGSQDIGDLSWWQIFQDEQLQTLIRTALTENYDVRIAAARVLDARAQLTIVRSSQFPTADAAGTASYTRAEGDVPSTQARESASVTGGINLAFEIDLWGRLRRATEAARAQLLASEEARRTVLTTLVGDLATAYFQLRELDLELEIARRTLASHGESLRLTQRRLEGGVVALQDVRQAETLVFTAAAAIPATERQIEQKENQISILLGRNPDAVPRGRPLLQQLALPEVPPGLPSTLLERRPDIRQAEQQLVAANAQIGVAKAAFFPQVLLTGSAQVGASSVTSVTSGPFGLYGLGPSVTVPIFNTGRTQAGVDSAEARREAAVLQYGQTIQTALREVSDAIVEYGKRREFRTQQQSLTESQRDAARLAKLRYRGGVTTYLEILDAERQLFTAELGLAQAQRDELLAVVQLYKALGGGWQP
jgi:multidrug efflux system outer membrane protein